VVTLEIVRNARVLIAQGLNVREAAARLRVGMTALYEALATEPADMHKHTAIRAAPSGLKVTAM